MTNPQHVSREVFLANLRESGLLSGAQFAAVVERLPASPRGRVAARALVQMGLLTRFQAEQLLAGRSSGFFLHQYRILDEVGRGGMGRVFKAVHQTMNRVVALKVLAPYSDNRERAQRLFFREMQAIARLSHPNIITAYDGGEIGNRAYLVMEYVDGPSLEQLVCQQGPLPVGQACEFVRQAALGLQYAFEKGMVHRDLKPGNLLIANCGLRIADSPRQSAIHTPQSAIVKILDFGLARLYEPHPFDPHDGDSILRHNVVMGTPDYVSPEQARNLHAADIRSDLYSLGCTLYYLLTGDVPFPGGSVMEKLIRHATDMPVPVARRRSDVPAGVAAVLQRLLAKRPEDRFQTPAELAAALEPFAVAMPVHLAPPQAAQLPVESETADDLFRDLASWTRDESAGLLATVVPGASITHFSAELSRQPRRRRTPAEERRRRILLAVGIAVGLVAGLLGLLGLLWGR